MLNTKQKKTLRALGHGLASVVHIGKEGLSINVVHNIHTALEAHELIKIQVLKTCPTVLSELMIDISRLTHSEVVYTIGKTMLFYRPTKEKKIKL